MFLSSSLSLSLPLLLLKICVYDDRKKLQVQHQFLVTFQSDVSVSSCNVCWTFLPSQQLLWRLWQDWIEQCNPVSFCPTWTWQTGEPLPQTVCQEKHMTKRKKTKNKEEKIIRGIRNIVVPKIGICLSVMFAKVSQYQEDYHEKQGKHSNKISRKSCLKRCSKQVLVCHCFCVFFRTKECLTRDNVMVTGKRQCNTSFFVSYTFLFSKTFVITKVCMLYLWSNFCLFLHSLFSFTLLSPLFFRLKDCQDPHEL